MTPGRLAPFRQLQPRAAIVLTLISCVIQNRAGQPAGLGGGPSPLPAFPVRWSPSMCVPPRAWPRSGFYCSRGQSLAAFFHQVGLQSNGRRPGFVPSHFYVPITVDLFEAMTLKGYDLAPGILQLLETFKSFSFRS